MSPVKLLLVFWENAVLLKSAVCWKSPQAGNISCYGSFKFCQCNLMNNIRYIRNCINASMLCWKLFVLVYTLAIKYCVIYFHVRSLFRSVWCFYTAGVCLRICADSVCLVVLLFAIWYLIFCIPLMVLSSLSSFWAL